MDLWGTLLPDELNVLNAIPLHDRERLELLALQTTSTRDLDAFDRKVLELWFSEQEDASDARC